MRLSENIDNLCSNYAVPINFNTVGLLQFYHEFEDSLALDVLSLKTYFVEAFSGSQTQTIPINSIIQKDGTTFRILVQGINNIPENKQFRIKFEVKLDTLETKTFYSDVFLYN